MSLIKELNKFKDTNKEEVDEIKKILNNINRAVYRLMHDCEDDGEYDKLYDQLYDKALNLGIHIRSNMIYYMFDIEHLCDDVILF